MYEILKKNIPYKLLAILLAILLWLYVTNLQNPTIEKTLNIPVAYYNLKEQFVLENKPDEVEVKIRGLYSIINYLSEKEIRASVDLAKAKVGEDDYLVGMVTPAGVELVYVKPASIRLSIDEVQEKQLPIKAVLTGTVATGYSSFEPVLEPSTVLVKGARRMLENLAVAQVTVDINQKKNNVDINSPVTLLTKEGENVTASFTVSPQNIQVFVPVTENKPNKTVSIRPILKGEPGEGFKVATVILDPETVKISGTYDVLSQINQVVTAPIDITGIVANSATQVALVPPEGASLLYDPVVKVLVQVETVPITKTIPDVPVTGVKSNEEDYKYILKPEKANLTLKGSKEEITALDLSAVQVYVDLEGLEQGLHYLEAKVNIPASLEVVKIEPATIEVKITQN